MENNNTYFSSFFKGIKSLSIGLKTTMREFFTPKVTEQYPENRKELKMFDRFRGTLVTCMSGISAFRTSSLSCVGFETNIIAWPAACARWPAPTAPSA